MTRGVCFLFRVLLMWLHAIMNSQYTTPLLQSVNRQQISCQHEPYDIDKHNSLHVQIKDFCSLRLACIFYSHNMGMNCDLAFAWRHTKLKVVCKILPLDIIRFHIEIS